MELSNLPMLPLWYAAFLLSVTCHEAAHAWVAYRGGDDTAYRGGQVSLNPVPHILREPFGTVLVPLLTFVQAGWMMGWASAPYDPYWEERHPGRAAAMAAAGPGANLVLATLVFLGLRAGLSTGVFSIPTDGIALDDLVAPGVGATGLEGLGRFLSVVLSLNLILFVFNLLPVPPMDGASVLAGLVPPLRPFYIRVRRAPMTGLVGLVVAWFVFPYVFPPIRDWVLFRLYT